MTDRVDILLPAYQAQAVLPDALDSLLAQTHRDWVAWVLDDGSEDGTLAVAERYAAADGRIRPIALPHRGLVSTLNEGLTRGDAPWVARMDADDICQPRRLAAQLALFAAQPGLGVTSVQIATFRSGGAPPGPGMLRYVAWQNRLLSPADHRRERFVESPVAHSAVLGRRAVFSSGYRDLDIAEDYDLWLRLLAQGVAFAKVPEVLLHVRDDGERLSRRDARYFADAMRAAKIAHLTAPGGPLRGRRSLLFWGAGRVGKPWLRELPRAGVVVDAVVDLDPRKIGKQIHRAEVIPPDALGDRWRARADPFLLAGVGAPGARAEIRAWLGERGYREGDDYLFVA